MSDTVTVAETAPPAPPALNHLHALFLDFDGTLVEIAELPGLVSVPPELAPLLGRVSALLDGALAIVSGRSVDDLIPLLAPFPGILVGQHGLECRRADGRMIRGLSEPALGTAHGALAAFAATRKGVLVEDKGESLALHFRLAPWFAGDCVHIVRGLAAASEGTLQAIDGKMVIELVPGASGKGQATTSLLAIPPFIGRVPIFIGDDSSDEAGFATVNRLGGISIHVGAGTTLAQYRFASAGAVRAWLAQAVAR